MEPVKDNMVDKNIIKVSGAGPAGFAAALAISRAGLQAHVYEKRSDVGGRFHGDFQGLENWTTDIDVLDELGALGVDVGFDYTPFHEVTCFSPQAIPRVFRSTQPLFYLIRRGNEAGCLDKVLQKQSLKAGVQLHYNKAVHKLPEGGIVTQGPRRADAIAIGYLFDTDMADCAYAAISDQLAPKGYAYLLISNGRGTLASCLFDDFHNEKQHLERCLEFFTDKVGVHMKNPRRFGGVGNFSIPQTARKGNILYAGESAGFQDPLFGFGIRSAMLSGAAAGRALAEGAPDQYEEFWKRRLRAFHQAAATNRWFYEKLGNRGYEYALSHFTEGADVRDWMKKSYAPRVWKWAWYQLFAHRSTKPLLNLREDCDCTWCRCKQHMAKDD